ncbi:SpoIIIAH-like family protein [Mobilitalea sibirica]|uniref:SpoIIIAH-like family protein n=1 Tax=Mobilitalea sibirica TaxID=1462919 RepID=A0A8J7KZH3_9FIRM|nr:SpoIIIAH-like family protein [Mobilitalea sibirica]MBH1940203.1 SpoIIIAH-like family protein [Mobilitalea sibirica]
MKNIFKKNQIIITALAIMIVIAGYLSFTNDDKPEEPGTVETTNPDLEELDVLAGLDGLDVVQNTDDTTDANDTTDADTTDETEVTNDTTDGDVNATEADDNDETTPVDTEEGTTELGELSDDDILEAASDVTDTGELNLNEDSVPGEAVLASTNINAGYFIENRLQREQMRARNKETLKELFESPDVAETLKQDAINSYIEITAIAEKENATEILLEARGFDDTLVSINSGKVDVVVNAASLTDQQLAIIENAVKEKTEIEAKNITIIPVVMEE